VKPFWLLIAVFCLSGCLEVHPPEEDPPIQQLYSSQLSKLKIGMSLEEFRGVMPMTYPIGQNRETTAYELKDVRKYATRTFSRPVDTAMGLAPSPYRDSVQILWFYFYNGQLVQWGRPNDWPVNPDKIIEIRQR